LALRQDGLIAILLPMITPVGFQRCGFPAGHGGLLTASMLLGLVVHATVSFGAEPTAAGEHFPLTAAVRTTHTYLRAGPGADYYPTTRLIQGEAVELWSVDASGYGAVRPLTGSFSWLRAADVDRQIEADPAIGVVVTDGAVARIGSQINDLRHVAQVRLEAGERVRVLDEERIEQGRQAVCRLAWHRRPVNWQQPQLAAVNSPPTLPRPARRSTPGGKPVNRSRR